MTTTKTTVGKTPPAPSPSDDVKVMGLYERLWHVQTEARDANGTTKAYNGTYADRVAVWNNLLQPLFAKYRLLMVTTLSEYKTTDLSGNPDTAPLLICSLHRAEDDENHKSPLHMRFHLKNGSEQDLGKQMTYFNRYALVQMCGISINKDPDDPDHKPEPVAASTPRPTVDPRILAGAQNTTNNNLDEFE